MLHFRPARVEAFLANGGGSAAAPSLLGPCCRGGLVSPQGFQGGRWSSFVIHLSSRTSVFDSRRPPPPLCSPLVCVPLGRGKWGLRKEVGLRAAFPMVTLPLRSLLASVTVRGDAPFSLDATTAEALPREWHPGRGREQCVLVGVGVEKSVLPWDTLGFSPIPTFRPSCRGLSPSLRNSLPNPCIWIS